jgi:hypothetical protein
MNPLNTQINQTPRSAIFGYRMARREHHEIASLARNHQLTTSGLIRALLREWRAQQQKIDEVCHHGP